MLSGFVTWRSPPPCSLRKTCILQQTCIVAAKRRKTYILASWRPRRPPDRRASWRPRRPRRPPDGPPVAPDGPRTGFLSPQTASGHFSWRPRRPPDEPPGVQDGLLTSRRQAGLRRLCFSVGSTTLALLFGRLYLLFGRAAWPSVRTGRLAPKSAFGRAAWRPSRHSDGPSDGLRRL